jgi:arginyl-tRNA synthetase
VINISNIEAFQLSANRFVSSSLKLSVSDTIFGQIETEVRKSIVKEFGEELKDIDPMISLAKPSNGDYQSNIAMSLSKKLKAKPTEIAEKIVSNIEVGNIIEKIDIAGPGFINLHLATNFIQQRLFQQLIDPSKRIGIAMSKQPMKIVVDFSSPNIAKEMHVVRKPFNIFIYISNQKTSLI